MKVFRIRKSQGFTLIELMVTVGLVAFLGLILAKTFNTSSWLAQYRLRSAARELALHLQKARINAIKENRSWAVVFDTGSGNYSLVSSGTDRSIDATADNTTAETVAFSGYKNGVGYGRGGVGTAPRTGGDISSDVTFSSARVVFNSQGLADGNGYCYLKNDQGGVYAVEALISGIVKVKRWNGSIWQ